MNKKATILIIIIALIVIGFWYYQKGKPVAEPGIIKLGVITPMSGPAASMGEGIKNSIELAIKDNVEVIYEDDQCDTKKAVSAYSNLKIQGIKVYYVACSGSVLALAPLAKQDGNLILTAYAGSAEIRSTGDEVIRFNPDALSVVDAMADYLTTSPYKKFGILFEQQDYAKSVADVISTKLGDKVVQSESYLSSTSDVKTQLTKLKASSAEVIIFIPTSDKVAQIALKQMKDLSLDKPIIGEVNVCDYPFKPSDFGLHGVCWKAELVTQAAKDFEENYTKAYGAPSPFPFYDAETYDIAVILNKLALQGVTKVSDIKESILRGIKGDITEYKFEPNGEIIGKDYLTKIEF